MVAQLSELGFAHAGDTGLELDANFADTSQVTAEQAGDRGPRVGELAAGSLRDVEAAIDRLDLGTYGICERCGNPIEPARLEALPAARFCIADASSAR